MKLILTCALVAITSTSYGAFSMEDYLKAKAAQGNPVIKTEKVEPIVTDYALGINRNQVRITSNTSRLETLITTRATAQSELRKAEVGLTSAIVNLAKVKARVNANKQKTKVSTGHPLIRAASKIVAQATSDLRKAKKGLAGMSLKIRNCERSIATAKQRVVYYTHKLAQEKESAGACA